MTERQRQICEDLDWRVTECDDGTIELQKYSPAGEDFLFSVEAKGFCREVLEYAADFDVDEHVEMWLPSRGKRGVPSTARELVEDAEAIDKMLDELADALTEAENEEDEEDTECS